MDKFSNISLKNIAWFNDVNQKGNLDMSPSYQRNAVWTTRQKGAPDKPCGVGRADANPKLLLNDT